MSYSYGYKKADGYWKAGEKGYGPWGASPIPPGPPAPTPVGYWKMDTAAGNVPDEVGTNDMVPSAAYTQYLNPLYVGGKGIYSDTNGFRFDTTTTAFDPQADFSIAVWLGNYSGGSNKYFYLGPNTAYDAAEHSFLIVISGTVTFNGYTDNAFASWADPPIVGGSAIPSGDAKRLYIFTWDQAAKQAAIYHRLGNPTPEGAWGSSVKTVPLQMYKSAGTNKLRFWINQGGSPVIDELGVYDHVLDATERDNLFNGGAGITYPQV